MKKLGTYRIAALAVFLVFGCSTEVKTIAIPDSRTHQIEATGCHAQDPIGKLDATARDVCGNERYGIRNIRYNHGCKHEIRAVIVCADLPAEREP